MNKYIIKIDTSYGKKAKVSLFQGKNLVDQAVLVSRHKAQATLPLIEKLLNNNSISTGDLEKIYVREGPGSYTGLRVGAAIANTLSFLLDIPINDLKSGSFQKIVYHD